MTIQTIKKNLTTAETVELFDNIETLRNANNEEAIAAGTKIVELGASVGMDLAADTSNLYTRTCYLVSTEIFKMESISVKFLGICGELTKTTDPKEAQAIADSGNAVFDSFCRSNYEINKLRYKLEELESEQPQLIEISKYPLSFDEVMQRIDNAEGYFCYTQIQYLELLGCKEEFFIEAWGEELYQRTKAKGDKYYAKLLEEEAAEQSKMQLELSDLTANKTLN